MVIKFFKVIFTVILITNQVIGYFVQDQYTEKTHDEKFHDFLETKLREIMRNGDKDLEIPVIDPYVGDNQIIKIDDDSQPFAFILRLNNFDVEKLSTYIIENSNLKIFPFPTWISIKITLPEIISSGLYQLDGVAFQDVPLYGKGKFKFIATNISISAVTSITITGGIRIQSLDLKISLEKIDFKATGIFYDDSTSVILSQVISDVLPEIVSVYYHDNITAIASQKLINLANEKLKGKTLKDLLNIFN
ncbi:uncharacterized protein LOC130671607 [Microplitis mediator]|uniref:uncharacterized protein LOC130671607 n=1 Tax=Microplitis mediator TaxID=375433 RepID=UPI00255313E5|nr:uncharacterized protein LOC130671607 [Microplitis mediator]XP_057331592.1 uncharacterized protein LOC130671607 [Microplitis mediator]